MTRATPVRGHLHLVTPAEPDAPADRADLPLLAALVVVGVVPLAGAALGGRWDAATLVAAAGLALVSGHELVWLIRSLRRARA